VGSVVFEYEQPARRAKAISLLIDICQVRIFGRLPGAHAARQLTSSPLAAHYDQASLRLNNYNTVFALLAGLNNTAVSRLKLTWEVRS
jgi:hypothetical protein